MQRMEVMSNSLELEVLPAGKVAGTKRAADESSLSGDGERFAKRFNLLNLDPTVNGNSNYYIPVSRAPSPAAPPRANIGAVGRAVKDGDNGLMQVDDTRHRVYIHNLDEELADVDAGEEKLIFLPDIEKHFSKIPKHVLTGNKKDDHEGQELVLYSVPKSLTVDEGHDSVRKAILETRQRARDKAVEDARHQDMDRKYEQSLNIATETAHGYGGGYGVIEQAETDADPDAMDMD